MPRVAPRMPPEYQNKPETTRFSDMAKKLDGKQYVVEIKWWS